MAKKGGLGLGKGLDALMDPSDNDIVTGLNPSDQALSDEKSSSTEASSSKKTVKLYSNIEQDDEGHLWIDPVFLIPNPNQPRQEFDSKKIEELADSIRENGIIEPIVIEKTEDSDNFYIIAGERRTRAARLVGLKKVPVYLSKYDKIKKLEVALIENIQRVDLNPIDEANAYYNLMQMGDLTQDEVAKRVGKKRSTVANFLRLLKLPEDIQKSLIDGQISSGHARAILMCENMADQRILFGKIVGSGLSVRNAEDMARDLNNGSRASGKKISKKTPKKDSDIVDVEQKFIEVFGTKVNIKGSLDKGSIVIDYYSKEDLDRLYNVVVRQ